MRKKHLCFFNRIKKLSIDYQAALIAYFFSPLQASVKAASQIQ